MWMKAPGRAADVVVGQRHVTVAFACAHRSLPFLRCFSKEFPFTLRFLKNIVVSQATNVCCHVMSSMLPLCGLQVMDRSRKTAQILVDQLLLARVPTSG